ncbi:hypothetical protein [Acetobacter senegalensis]|uniref:hypothetical protein n=1 Tax=Acetobacter senegalensis TaxID=446692 RepID=UPI001EDB6BF8|nr:hypothetical protein [Acetobacter senegalensis]MCG4258498.1 hypothetical protein [Acetobacter senegalensis]MCG4268465.1 hypothetical protein [Acetobacter senegalensis]
MRGILKKRETGRMFLAGVTLWPTKTGQRNAPLAGYRGMRAGTDRPPRPGGQTQAINAA